MLHAALLVLALCSPAHAKKPKAEPAPTPPPPAMTDPAAVRSEADALWEQRGDPQKLRDALAKYEQLAAAGLARDVGMRLVRGWYFLGDGHSDAKEDKLAAWDKAVSWGNRCLALNTGYAGLLDKGDETAASAARAFAVEDVPCLYWTSSALGKWAKLSGIGATLKHLPTVKAYMTRVGELDNTFFYYGPDRYWGAYYAAIPSFAGQDLNKSKEYFDKSIAGNGVFLGTHVLLAAEWAVKKQDKATFEKELNWVLAQSTDAIPEIKPEAEAEQRKAKAYLAAESDYFAN